MSLDLTATNIQTLQAMQFGYQHGATQLFTVAGVLYYVTINQVGAAPDNLLVVYRSTDKVTWTLCDSLPPVIGYQNNHNQDCPACVVGTKIYIVGTILNSGTGVCNLIVNIFDTVTGLFVASSSFGEIQGGAGQQLWSISAFNSGVLLISSTTTTPAFRLQTYTPGTDSWSVPITAVANASAVNQQIHDPVSDLTFVFFRNGATQVMRCLTVTSGLAVTNTLVLDFVLGSYPIATVGMPIVTATEIVIPIRVNPLVGAPVLKVARATIAASPVFSVELVEDCSTLPVNSMVQQWDQIGGPGWMCMVIADLLYCFYTIDNGDLDSAASQAWLYYRTSTGPGSWSAPQIAYTGAVPGEQMIPYGTSDLYHFDPVILLGSIDPGTWPSITSLSTWVLFTLRAAWTQIDVSTLPVIGLPNPAGKC